MKNPIAIERLAELDWSSALLKVKALARSEETRSRALGLSLLYVDAVRRGDGREAVVLRKDLGAIAEDSSQAGHARDIAVKALLVSEWGGMDLWYASLFRDSTISAVDDGAFVFRPLMSPLESAPDRWVPIVSRIIGGECRIAHDTAVECLARLAREEPRDCVVLPLLPWLLDRGWSSAQGRVDFINALRRTHLPEAVPGLIAVLEREQGLEKRAAARALARQEDGRAVPSLRKAIEQESVKKVADSCIAALVELGAVSEEEVIEAIETYGRAITGHCASEVGVSEGGHWPDVSSNASAALGRCLVQRGTIEPTAATGLLQRVEELAGAEELLSTNLQRILYNMPGDLIDKHILKRLQDGRPSAVVFLAALRRRVTLRSGRSEILRAVARRGGIYSGLSAVILQDQDMISRAMKAGDRMIMMGLLACCRLVREPLPLDGVKLWLQKGDNLLSHAAERYLEDRREEEADELLFTQHRASPRILGDCEEGSIGHLVKDVFGPLEAQLQEEFLKDDKLSEVYALLSWGIGGDDGQRIIRKFMDRTDIEGRYGTLEREVRRLSDDDVREVNELLVQNDVEHLPPLITSVLDGIQFEYVRLHRRGGRRVFMNNPGFGGSGGTDYDRIVRLFRRLTRGMMRDRR